VAAARTWLQHVAQGVDAADGGRRPGLHPAFPGFAAELGFRSELAFEDRLTRQVSSRALKRLDGLPPAKRVNGAVTLYLEELDALAEERAADVVVCCIPSVVLADDEEDATLPPDALPETFGGGKPGVAPAFHDLLKAQAMQYRLALQLLRPSTYDPTQRKLQRRARNMPAQLQDEAVRAWNMLTALYYKARGCPWRLVRASSDLDVCFVGVAFYTTADGEETATSVAQVFNQRGDGVIVRGGSATRSTEDRQLHLNERDASELLAGALQAFRREHKHPPARIVVHKTSSFSGAELDGMLGAADNVGLESCELIWVTNASQRLFRAKGELPPLRGTMWELSDTQAVLYTRGSVETYGCYPGGYIPRPLGLRVAHAERGLPELGAEVLALSKMNWNSTSFDGRLPVTIRTARQVADIIKHVPADGHIEHRYATYM
jgi:hypothetical protein